MGAQFLGLSITEAFADRALYAELFANGWIIHVAYSNVTYPGEVPHLDYLDNSPH